MVAINRIGQRVDASNLCPASQAFPVLQDVSTAESGSVWTKFTRRAPPYCNDCMWIFYPNHTLFDEYGVVNVLEPVPYNTVKSHLLLAAKGQGYDVGKMGPLFTRTAFPIEFGSVEKADVVGTKAVASAAGPSTVDSR